MVDNDWRITNQEDYLKGVKLKHSNYEKWSSKWDHDHCAFCWEKFIEESQTGYCTLDKYHWICEQCFDDFKDLFKWELVE